MATRNRAEHWRSAVCVIAALLGGGAIGCVVALFEKNPKTASSDTSIAYLIFVFVLVLAQAAYLSFLLQSLSIGRTEKANGPQRAVKLAFCAGVPTVVLFAALVAIEWKAGQPSAAAVAVWVAVTMAFVFLVSKISALEWRTRLSLRREIAAFLIGTSTLTLLVFVALAAWGAETTFWKSDQFTREVLQTALIAATILSAPACVWVLFLLNQPEPTWIPRLYRVYRPRSLTRLDRAARFRQRHKVGLVELDSHGKKDQWRKK
jgi:hypothetical protein